MSIKNWSLKFAVELVEVMQNSGSWRCLVF
jgi:hypothetical protein